MIVYSSCAEADLDQIWFECSNRSGEQRAAELLERINSTILLGRRTFPNSGRLRVEFGTDVRSYPLPPYVVFYRVVEKRVELLRILHGHRDLGRDLMSLLVAV